MKVLGRLHHPARQHAPSDAKLWASMAQNFADLF